MSGGLPALKERAKKGLACPHARTFPPDSLIRRFCLTRSWARAGEGVRGLERRVDLFSCFYESPISFLMDEGDNTGERRTFPFAPTLDYKRKKPNL